MSETTPTPAELIETLLDALCDALPFVENAETDPAYRRGVVRKHVSATRAAIAQAETFLKTAKEPRI